MAFTCWTLDGTYTGESVRQSFAYLSGWAPSGRPLGATSGVRSGTPTTTVSITGSGPYSAVVGPHAGVLDVETSGTAAPYGYANNSNFTQVLNAADATNPRIDLISVQLTDTNEGDTGTSGLTVAYTAGTPAATPGVPAAPARSMVLAQITVPKATTGAPTVTWVAPVFDDTGWRSSGLTGIGGGITAFTLGYTWRVRAGVMYLNLAVSRNVGSATLTMGGTGILADTPFATISGAYAPTTPLSSSYVSSHCSGGALWDGTNFKVTDGHPGGIIAGGDIVKALFTYPLG